MGEVAQKEFVDISLELQKYNMKIVDDFIVMKVGKDGRLYRYDIIVPGFNKIRIGPYKEIKGIYKVDNIETYKYSNVTIHSKVKLDAEELHRLKRIIDHFERFSPGITQNLILVIGKSATNHYRGMTNVREKKIYLDYDPKYMETALFHELSHILYRKANKVIQMQTVDLYRALATITDLKNKKSLKEIEAEPVWQVIDESSILKQPWRIGHPYQSPQEMFASTLTCLYFNKKEVYNRLLRLDGSTPYYFLASKNKIVKTTPQRVMNGWIMIIEKEFKDLLVPNKVKH